MADPQFLHDNLNAAYAPIPSWRWDAVSHLDTLIEEANSYIDAGVRRLVIQPAAGEAPALSDNWYDAANQVLEHLARRGCTAWLHTGAAIPGCLGPVFRTEGLPAARVLHGKVAECGEGERLFLPVPMGEPVSMTAFRMDDGMPDASGAVDVSHAVEDRILEWGSPGGRWLVAVFAAQPVASAQSVDLMDPDSGRTLVRQTLDHLSQKLGNWFGHTLEGLIVRGPGMPHLLPWSARFADQFRMRRRYDITPRLMMLVRDGAGAESIRIDYRTVSTDLYIEAFLHPLHSGLNRAGLKLAGQPAQGGVTSGDALLATGPGYGAYHFDWQACLAPDGICLHLARGVVAASRAEATLCRLPVEPGRSDEQEMFYQAMRAVTRGATRVLVGADDAPAAEVSIWCQSARWTAMHRVLQLVNDRPLSRILVYRPSITMTANSRVSDFAHGRMASGPVVDAPLELVCNALEAHQHPFIVHDSRALCGMSVRNRSLVYCSDPTSPGVDVVILPAVSHLSAFELRLLAAFVNAGGAVCALGALPEHGECPEDDASVREARDLLFGKGQRTDTEWTHHNAQGGKVCYLPLDTDRLIKLLDHVAPPAARLTPLREEDAATMRRMRLGLFDTPSGQAVVCLNTGTRTCDMRLLLQGEVEPRIWNPDDGSLSPCEWMRASGHTQVPLRIDPRALAVVVYAPGGMAAADRTET